jgi:uncharacterized protein
MAPFSTPLESIDVFELARLGGVVEGQLAFSAAPRLRVDLRTDDGGVAFRLQGSIDGYGRPAAQLMLRATLPLTCDRCARPLDLPIEHEAAFYFVQEESELAAVPIAPEEDAEPLLGSASFGVGALVEDETILCIPVSPRHGACPAETARDAPDDSKPPHPFAGLASLLRNKAR